MRFDFAAVLVILTALAGLIWALDRLILAKRRADAGKTTEPVVVDYARSLFPVLLLVLVVRSFLAEPFRIPSSSMMPTLLIGDFILVNKYAYGIRLPVINQKVIAIGAPERGDVVVFRPPHHPDQDWIKRIVGLPGDEIAYIDKVIYVNGQAQGQTRNGPYIGTGSGREMTGALALVETLGESQHRILQSQNRASSLRGEGRWVVPEGQYFVLGDNRDNSEDSRFWGFLPEQNLVGRAFLVWMHWDRAGGGVDFSRIGEGIE
ncbi:MAG TPA: signal peptidase I [Xanthomonadales bacterium]|nr:signal peptidase I [Xanthomonadales bacterium]